MADTSSDAKSEKREGRFVKAPETLAAGVFLLVLAEIGFWGSIGIAAGTLAKMGAGMFPRVVSLLIGALGVFLVVQSFTVRGPALERWLGRGVVFVLGAAVVFGLTIRGFSLGSLVVPPLGLAVAGPLAVIIASLADRETRWLEIILYAAFLNVLCFVVFKQLLRLPIPIAPWLLGY